MDPRTMLRIVTIACCFVACFAGINPDDLVCNEEPQPAHAENGILNSATGLNSDLSNAVQQKFEEMKATAAPLISPGSLPAASNPKLLGAAKDAETLYEKSVEHLQDDLGGSNFKFDIEALSEEKNFVKNDTLHLDIDTAAGRKVLETVLKARDTNKKSNSGVKHFYGIISIIMPVFLAILMKF